MLFITGAWYGYFVAALKTLYFLSGWNEAAFDWNPDGNETVSFFVTLTIGLGLAFQLLVIMFVIAKIGIFSSAQMRKVRKYAFILILIAAAIITPSTDPYNMMIVAIPIYALYEMGIVVASIFVKSSIRGTLSENASAVEITPENV